VVKVHSGEEMLPKASIPRVGSTNIADDRRNCDSKDPNVK